MLSLYVTGCALQPKDERNNGLESNKSTATYTKPVTKKTASVTNNTKKNPIQGLNSFYHVDELHNEGYTGKGTRIAIVSLAPVNLQHVRAFCSYYHLTYPTIKTIDVEKPSHDYTRGHLEIDMDIEYSYVAAPGAEIDVYVGSNELDIWKRIAEDGIATVATTSFEEPYTYQDLQSNTQKIKEYNQYLKVIDEVTQKGITVFGASGDTEGNSSNTTLLLPSVLPNVVSVGGTELDVSNEQNISENDWVQSTGGWTPFKRPSYQDAISQTPNIPNDARTHRMFPDIASVANEVAIYTDADIQDNRISIFSDNLNAHNWSQAWGTSLSSPYLAGIFADISGGLHKRLGDIHETLYKAVGTSVFNKVQPVSDSYFKGGSSYNLITGLGSLNAVEIAKLFGLK